MYNLIIRLFGSYAPYSYTVTEKVWDEANQVFVDVTNTIIPDGMAGVDWPWIAGVFLFAVVLSSILHIIGAVISKV